LLRSVAPQLSLPERAAKDIRDAVRSGAYPDGRLPAEPMLAQQLGVSKATVRHAVSVLEQEGLLPPGRRHLRRAGRSSSTTT
jgi:GntR family transcriptional regulator